MTRSVAAFDFDGTITQRDTLGGYLLHAGGPGALLRAGASNLGLMIRGLRDDSDRDAAKEQLVCGALAGLTESDLTAAGEEYARTLTKKYRDETLAQVVTHRARKHQLVIVSASLVYYLRPVAAELGFEHVIGVELNVGRDGLVSATTGLNGPNVRGPEKERRLRAWLAETGTGPDDDLELWAYGNSSGDDQLLAMSDHPTWIGKRAKTKA